VVVLVADIARTGNASARVYALTCGLCARMGGLPGSRGLVSGRVVDVLLGPVGCVDRSDSACCIKIEAAGAGIAISDAGRVAVGTIGVAAVLERALVYVSDLLGGQAAPSSGIWEIVKIPSKDSSKITLPPMEYTQNSEIVSKISGRWDCAISGVNFTLGIARFAQKKIRL
jgi:hypothetical protein